MAERLVAFIQPSTGKYRLRTPGDLAEQLGWPRPGSGFQCFGFFRAHGELLCTAQEGQTPERIALLRSTMTAVAASPNEMGAFAEVPPAGELLASLRVIEFRAIWLKPPHTELELQLSSANLARLGWHAGGASPIAALVYSRVLILMSEARYAALHTDMDL